MIQEISVCPKADVVYGSFRMGWDRLEAAQLDSARLFGYRFHGLMAERKGWWAKETQDLVTLVVKHIGAEATDERDKIFALFGLADQSRVYDVQVDYSTPVKAVFSNLTRSCLGDRDDLDILSFGNGCREPSLDVPSWVFTSVYNNTIDPLVDYSFAWATVLHEDGRRFQATKDSRSQVRFSEGNGVLGLKGFQLDTVSQIGEIMPDMLNRPFQFNWKDWSGLVDHLVCYASWQEICQIRSAQTYGPTGQGMSEVFWQTCSATVPDLESQTDYIRAEFERFDNFMRVAGWLARKRSAVTRPLHHLSMLSKTFRLSGRVVTGNMAWLDWVNRIDAGTSGRMIRTKEGYIGLAPRYVKIGDVITLFSGAKVPLIIRHSQARWRLVGECYVHGIMQGEAFEENICNTIWLE